MASVLALWVVAGTCLLATTPQSATAAESESSVRLPASQKPPKSEHGQNGPVRNVIRDRAMWLWNWGANDDVIRFADANHVKEIFVYAHPGFLQDETLRARLADLTNQGKAAGIRMWAMGGDPSWVTEQSVAVTWVADAVSSGMFNGIHFEIEPHLQAGYVQHQKKRNVQFIELLNRAHAVAQHHTFEISLPWWYHTIDYRGSTLDEAAIKAVDQVTIITFNTSVEGVEMNVRAAETIAKKLGKSYRLASETNTVDPAWITFDTTTNQRMLKIQNAVSRSRVNDPLYLGFAVHEYLGWNQLRR